MSLMPIYNCFHPVLREKTQPVTEFSESLKQLVDDLYETMYSIANGVGLAANQIGISKSVAVIDMSTAEEGTPSQPITLVNPAIEWFSEEEEEGQEGCLSIPTYFEKVWRAKAIKVRYNDINGEEHILEAEDFLARVIQHEVDHLNGILVIDRITSLKRALSKSKLKKIERGEILGDYSMVMPDDTLIEPVLVEK